VPEPTLIADAKHLLRTIRYVHLNACREQLVGDPLLWPWSTHRGVVGAEQDPWLDARRLAGFVASNYAESAFVAWFHRYVSSDPSCAPGGTPLPVAAPKREWPAVALADVVSAAIAATPWSNRRGAWRRLAIALAAHQGIRDRAALSHAIGIDARTVRHWASRPSNELLAPGALCLGDARLRLQPKHEAALSDLTGDSTRRAHGR
jgi:hypothetical protein